MQINIFVSLAVLATHIQSISTFFSALPSVSALDFYSEADRAERGRWALVQPGFTPSRRAPYNSFIVDHYQGFFFFCYSSSSYFSSCFVRRSSVRLHF